MITQSIRIRIKSTFNNPLSEKLREKHENSFIKNAHKDRHFPKS